MWLTLDFYCRVLLKGMGLRAGALAVQELEKIGMVGAGKTWGTEIPVAMLDSVFINLLTATLPGSTMITFCHIGLIRGSFI